MRVSQSFGDDFIKKSWIAEAVDSFSGFHTQRLETPLKGNAMSLCEKSNHLALELLSVFLQSQVGLGSPAESPGKSNS